MVPPRKKQTGFYATPEVERYLSKLEDGVKTKRINEILSQTIRLEEFGLIPFNCHFCMRSATGKPTFKFQLLRYCADDGHDILDESFDVLVVECPHQDCGNSSLIKLHPEWLSLDHEIKYERLYPEAEKLDGVPSNFTKNLAMAEAAYFNQDYNAVALYCRRLLIDISKQLMPSTSLNESFEQLLQLEKISKFELDWAKAIEKSTRSVIDGNEDINLVEAYLCLYFTKKLLESLFVLHEKLEKFEIQTTRRSIN